MKQLKKTLRKNINRLKKSKDISADILKKVYKAASDEIKKNRTAIPTDRTAELISRLCSDGKIPDEKTLADALKDKVPTAHLKLLYPLLLCALTRRETDEQSLSKLGNVDFGGILKRSSTAEKILNLDPAGIYPKMNGQTKELYRDTICKKAEKEGKSEEDAVYGILQKARNENRHVGYFLNLNKRSKAGKFLLTSEIILPLVAAVGAGIFTRKIFLPFLLYLPLWEAMRFIPDTVFAHMKPVAPLPKMDFSDGLPETEKAVIAVSTILPVTEEMRENIKKLYLSNCRDSAYVCILADLKSAFSAVTETDGDDIDTAIKTVDELNRECNNKIVLAVRKRVFCATQGNYCGAERKRGAIISLAKLIEKEEENDFQVLHGGTENLKNTKYIMALDSDTQMPIGSLRELVSVAAHPLNRPVISAKTNTVTEGYGIISPSVRTDAGKANATYFSSVMAGSGGLPSYCSHVREKYMELFGESIFCGKGVIDVKTFNALMPHRFPDGKILSHDIPEGIIMRTAYAGEVTLTDSFPTTENAYFKRLHRWIRGDVQNLYFLSGNEDKMPPQGIFLILDNIRRALTPAASVLSIAVSVFMPKKQALTASLIGLSALMLPDIVSLISTVADKGFRDLTRKHFSPVLSASQNTLVRSAVNCITAVRHAMCSSDAVAKSIFRMTVSGKNLLEWTTAAESEHGGNINLKQSVISAALGIFLLVSGNIPAKTAGLFFMLDLPFSVLSARKKTAPKPQLTPSEKETVTEYCKTMWQFFTDNSNGETNYLIPDHIQEEYGKTEYKTSPTNIGMMLCSFLAARDFGFIGTDELYTRLRNTFSTLDRMEKYRGHIYNWADVRTLKKVEPHFISSVDSGNLLCCLTALAKGLEEYLPEKKELGEIIGKCRDFVRNCDMAFLYDESKNLFRTGYDTAKNEFTDSHYDLLMSESRMMSYHAAASEKVPVSHWHALSRQVCKNGRYSGAVAWSGTMFEYFMPAIFLPDKPYTLCDESLRFCIYSQKKFSKRKKLPYGISESCYYELDEKMNYKYTANGVKSISGDPKKKTANVVSPYSSFMTLQKDPHAAAENLKELEKYGAYGRYGFYEAVDFRNKKEARLVKSFMSHHVGMSFLSAANAVFDCIMQKRFMSDTDMAGGESLTEEKIP